MLEILLIALVVAAATRSRDRKDSWIAVSFLVVVCLLVVKCGGG